MNDAVETPVPLSPAPSSSSVAVGDPLAGTFSPEEKNWLYGAHLGPLLISVTTGGLLAFVAPLAVWLHFKEKSPAVAEHARNALNFQLTLLIAVFALVAFMIVTLGFGALLAVPLLFLLFLFEVFGCVRASVQASKNEPARYPFNLELIKPS